MELLEISENPIPADAQVGTVETLDGTRLRYARWPPTSRKRNGTVTLMQGRTEFIEKYFEVIRELRSRGFAVVAFDWRGQGKSLRLLCDRKLGHVESFWDYVLDLETVFKEVVLPDSPAPHYVIAYSTGGSVLLLAANRFQSRLERAILVSPLVDLRLSNWIYRYPLKLIRMLNVRGVKNRAIQAPNGLAFQDLPFEGNVLTSDAYRYERISKILAADDELALGSPTIGWMNAAQQALSAFKETDFGISVRLPILFIAAGMDQVVSNSSAERLASRMPLAKYIELKGSRHEILSENDTIREQFWAAFDAFIPSTVE